MIKNIIQSISFDSAEDAERSVKSLYKLIKIAPYYDHAYLELANLYHQLRDAERELDIRLALEDNVPGIASNRFAIATLYLNADKRQKAMRWFDKGLNSPIVSSADRMQNFGCVTAARIHHDIAQINYLSKCQVLTDSYDEVLTAYHLALQSNHNNEDVWRVPRELLLEMAPFYRRCINIAQSDAVASCLRQNIDWQGIQQQMSSGDIEDRICVVDDFLNEETLKNLWRFCLQSTIWHNDSQKGTTYVGAYHHNGFSTPLINQLAREISVNIDETEELELSQIWAYRNVLGSHGIGVHADQSLLNVNIWLTPDQANHDPESGGLRIFKKGVPENWQFQDYNGNQEKIADYLQTAEEKIIPYKQNRAVIFDSGLFHASDKPTFGDTLEEMRLNVTFLYGCR